MFRLRVVPIFIPPLRQRPLDLDLLLRHFIDDFNRHARRVVTGIAPEVMRALLDHPWPGNVRELRNVVDYAFAVGRGPIIELDDLPPELREKRTPSPAREEIPGDEAERVRNALAEAEGDLDLAADRLGVSRTTFWRMRKRAGLI